MKVPLVAVTRITESEWLIVERFDYILVVTAFCICRCVELFGTTIDATHRSKLQHFTVSAPAQILATALSSKASD